MTDHPSILIVDDERININVLVDLLRDDYRIIIAKDGEQALNRIKNGSLPDLVLLDIMMPGMDGYEVCRRLKAEKITKDIPVIFISAMNEIGNVTEGFDLGAVDYVTKPISPPILLARVKTHITLKQARESLENQNRNLEKKVLERTRELAVTQDVTILCMASLAETRDNETGHHIRRTQEYVKVLAEKLKYHPRFSNDLGEHVIDLIYKSAPLHDIGKVGVPDNILLKPGKLTAEEFNVMKMHSQAGYDAILEAERVLLVTETTDQEHSFLRIAREIAYCHHEKWDGSGYPNGLQGEQIPLPARLMAIADVYDALISKRVYKPAYSHKRAVEIITQGKGGHFDPDVVDAFLELNSEFEKIATNLADLDANKQKAIEQEVEEVL